MITGRLTGLLASLLAGFVAGCGPSAPPEIQWKKFDGERAYAQVMKQVNYGPRPSGSPELGKTAVYFSSQLQEFGLEAHEQVFMAGTPRGPMQFRNVVGKSTGEGGDGKIIIVAAHYDTKWMTNTTFVGANDGASGAGVLLEMARVAAGQPNIWFVFFDGEEAMVEYSEDDGLRGSKFFVEELKRGKLTEKVKAMILLDMVGDARLNVTMPSDSSPALVQQVFDAARQVGYRDQFSFRDSSMLDDHVPFLKVGIPAVDIIDFEFGSAPGLNDYWHTKQDTIDKVSPYSLEVVGQTTLKLLENLKKIPSVK